MGPGAYSRKVQPVQVWGLLANRKATKVTAGAQHILVLTDENRLFWWGSSLPDHLSPQVSLSVYVCVCVRARERISVSSMCLCVYLYITVLRGYDPGAFLSVCAVFMHTCGHTYR